MIPILGIPHYNRPDLLLRCLRSIDHPIDTLVIIQNGPDDQMPTRTEIRDALVSVAKRVELICHPNAGVAGSWNEIIKLFPAPWWMFVNNDIQFTPDDLSKMARLAPEFQGAGMIYGNHGASWFVITDLGVEKVGLYDENIFPAYLEDCDWARRADLLGVRRFDIPDVHAIHGDGQLTGSCTINSDPLLASENARTHGLNFKYYRAKWGGNNDQETFTHPFNDPNHPLTMWHFHPAIRRANQWKKA